MARLLFSFLALATGTFAATLTATLKPATVNLGKSATLTLVCEGGIATTVEQTAAARNLALSFVDSTKFRYDLCFERGAGNRVWHTWWLICQRR